MMRREGAPWMTRPCSRRHFLGLAATAPLALAAGCGGGDGAPSAPSTPTPPTGGSGSVVALTRCRSYGAEVVAALRQSLDALGGIASLVRGKTVTVKVNLTGWPVLPLFGRSPGATYVTHGDTALALARILSDAGALRIRFVESVARPEPLELALDAAGWNVAALQTVPGVELENTRNLGSGSAYAHLPVPDGGRLFSSFELNRSYRDTDVFVSLAKMKEHATAAGVTLSMKNLFGLTPNSLYGSEGVGEDRLGYRGPIHDAAEGGMRLLPGEKPGRQGQAVGVRVPWTIVDLNAARPVHLAIVDGISTIRGGEGWWNEGVAPIDPGVVVAGFDAVATDAVSMAVMGFDPRAADFAPPFETRLNHVRLAAEAGLGTVDPDRIDVRGLTIEEARTPFRAAVAVAPARPGLSRGAARPIG
jgi:uncharacterized protein (DUF362 family)